MGNGITQAKQKTRAEIIREAYHVQCLRRLAKLSFRDKMIFNEEACRVGEKVVSAAFFARIDEPDVEGVR